jgi:integrating conjugative element protein (TIGR03756 family)
LKIINTYWLVGILLFGSVNDVMAATEGNVNTAEMVQQFANLECLNYCVVGACIYLVCTFFGCDIEVVPKISHNRPDLLVSSVSHPGSDPWGDAESTIINVINNASSSLFMSTTGFQLEGGIDAQPQKARKVILAHKDVHVLGTPMASINMNYFCPSDTSVFKPHLVTEADFFGWRVFIERFLPQSYIPGYREVGNWPYYTWGAVYPRMGMLNQIDDAKAAAVMAVRAMSIIKDGGMGHLYQSFPSINKNQTPWQRMTPNLSQQCEAFGTTNDLSWSQQTKSLKGNSWLYWQRYTCCADPPPGVKIGEVNFGPICI